MKKIYAIVLLTSIIASTSCMEKEPKKALSISDFVPVFARTLYQPLPHSTFITHTNVKKPNTFLMEQLYTNACTVIDYERIDHGIDSGYGEKFKKISVNKHKNLCILITNMKNAKKQGINEDMMGQFAYKSHDRNITSKYITLVFGCLKRYNLTVNNTQEALPFNVNSFCDKNLAQMFGIKDTKITNNELLPDTDISDGTLKPYTAYVHLISKLKYLLDTALIENMNALTHCLYVNEAILFANYSNGSYTDLTSEFYKKAYFLLMQEGNYLDIYNLLQIIKVAKKSGALQKETDLGHAVLTFDPTTTLSGMITNYRNKDYSTTSTKNRISLFCELVEQYNNAQPDKEKPTPTQYFCYHLHKQLDGALPDSFNNFLFDAKYYAFDEFNQFTRSVINLMRSDDASVQLCVDKIYHSEG